MCPGGLVDPMPLPGYFLIDRVSFDECRPSEACLGGPGSPCADGYRSIRCSACSTVRVSVLLKSCDMLKTLCYRCFGCRVESLSAWHEVREVPRHGMDFHRVVRVCDGHVHAAWRVAEQPSHQLGCIGNRCRLCAGISCWLVVAWLGVMLLCFVRADCCNVCFIQLPVAH